MTEIQTLNDFFTKHPMYHKSLAELMRVSVSVVDKWSNGDRRLTERTINELNRLDLYLNNHPEIRSKYVKVGECAA